MPRRIIAIGDVHGCSLALAAVLEAIEPSPEDILVPLGDYVDRGPDSRGVVDQLIALRGRCPLVPLLGNHEEMLLTARSSRRILRAWLEFGGAATLDSYGGDSLATIPDEHIAFLESCRTYYETETHFFVHANYKPDLPLQRQDLDTLRWLSLRVYVPGPHDSGKTAIVGHTPQESGEILDLGYLKCLDTNCCKGGWLTALDVRGGQVWQANERGELRG